MEIHLSTQRKLSDCVTLQAEIREKLRQRFIAPTDNCDLSRYHLQRATLLSQIEAEDAALMLLQAKNKYLEQSCELLQRNVSPRPPKPLESLKRYDRVQPPADVPASLASLRKYVRWTEDNTGLKIKSENGRVKVTFALNAKMECWAVVGVSNGMYDVWDTSQKLKQTEDLVAKLNCDRDWAAFVKGLRTAFQHTSNS